MLRGILLFSIHNWTIESKKLCLIIQNWFLDKINFKMDKNILLISRTEKIWPLMMILKVFKPIFLKNMTQLQEVSRSNFDVDNNHKKF